MIRIMFWEPSGETETPGKGTTHDHYSSAAFDQVTGQRVPFRTSPGGAQIGWATVIGVVVDDDGLGATWTVDVDQPVVGRAVENGHIAGMGFVPRPDESGKDAIAARFRDPLAARSPVIRESEGPQ